MRLPAHRRKDPKRAYENPPTASTDVTAHPAAVSSRNRATERPPAVADDALALKANGTTVHPDSSRPTSTF
ncbi:hypothetical protein SANTM175S_00044 [Streptomyces antimycoticus]